MSVHFKCVPMYEYIRPGIHVQFSQTGDFLTNDPKVIAALETAAPFIERVEPEVVAEEVVVEEVAEEIAEPAKKVSRTTRTK